MDNIGQIVYEAIRISFPEFIRLVFAGMAGGLMGAYVNDRLTRKRDKESLVDRDRKPLIKAIDEMIDNILGIDQPSLVVNYLHRIYEPFSTFRYHISEDRLAAYNDAWKAIHGTTHKELTGKDGKTCFEKGDKELQRLQQIIIGRLEALKEMAEKV